MNERNPVGRACKGNMAIGLIFDMDGVLFDSHPLHRKVWQQLLESVGRKVSGEELDFIMDGARSVEILQHFLGPLSPEQIAAYAARKSVIFRTQEEYLQTTEGLEAFLDCAETASIPKAVATSASNGRARRMLERHRLTGRFSTIVTGDDVPTGKSDPAIFLRSAEELRVAPGNLVVIEDAVPAIKAAKSVGMKCVGIATGARRSQLLQAGADFVVPDFRPLGMSDVFGLFR